ncbi:MAG: HAD-IC family P-type ATPase, partial [Fibrobacterota bacterium]
VLGNFKMLSQYSIDFDDFAARAQALEEEAKTLIALGVDGKFYALIAIADTVKEDAVRAVDALGKEGVQTAMITGDNEKTARAMAEKLGIDRVIANVLPDGKVAEIKRLQESYGTVAMVGDGINDAPALKQANVGIAIGSGTDIAIEAADITLVRGDVTAVVSALKLSRATFRKIRENYFWAWIYNGVAVPAAFFGLLHPMIGAGAMAISSLTVVLNSLGLKKTDIDI